MKQPYPIAREGFPYIIGLAVVTLVTYFLWPILSILPLILTFFVAFFFRNPKRVIPQDEGILVSPADGRVMWIEEVEEERFFKGKAIKISIFLSVFNVHLNRTPVSGKVTYRAYREGKMIPAFKSHASDINEKNFVGIENDLIKVLVTQVTGFIARRIVCWVKEGQELQRGQLFGLIKFGSCTEIYVPKSVEILVKEGERVIGGETVIGRIKNEF